MRCNFYQKLANPSGLAVLDLCNYYNQGFVITRINVPEAHRGKGIGAKLLSAATAAADEEGVTLWLEVASSGPLDNDALAAWYRRYGFRGSAIGVMRRKPGSIPIPLHAG